MFLISRYTRSKCLLPDSTAVCLFTTADRRSVFAGSDRGLAPLWPISTRLRLQRFARSTRWTLAFHVMEPPCCSICTPGGRKVVNHAQRKFLNKKRLVSSCSCTLSLLRLAPNFSYLFSFYYLFIFGSLFNDRLNLSVYKRVSRCYAK